MYIEVFQLQIEEYSQQPLPLTKEEIDALPGFVVNGCKIKIQNSTKHYLCNPKEQKYILLARNSNFVTYSVDTIKQTQSFQIPSELLKSVSS